MKKKPLTLSSIALLAFITVFTGLSFTACQTGGKQEAGDSEDEMAEPADELVRSTTEDGLIRMERGGITLTEVVSPVFEEATLTLVAPVSGTTVQDTSVAFSFTVDGYELGSQTADAAVKNCANSSEGQHIHLILNNEPYSAHYVSDFTRELSDGAYTALAFLSRSYHESLKNKSAYEVFTFGVGAGAEAPEFDESGPHMFYSRPKGTYNGDDAKKVLLDFYLVNADLSADGHKVKAVINGTEFILDKWVPYAMEGLPDGETTIELTFVDATGAKVESPFNPVVRSVTLAQ